MHSRQKNHEYESYNTFVSPISHKNSRKRRRPAVYHLSQGFMLITFTDWLKNDIFKNTTLKMIHSI